MSNKRRVLYIATCATPAAAHIGTLVGLAQASGWTTCVMVTPNALNFVNVPAIQAQTGFPVRCKYRRLEEVNPFPPADGVILAGASFNTLNKLANGITDTLVLSTVVETMGMDIPVVLVPFFNTALGKHPAWRSSVHTLRELGVAVLVSPGLYEPHVAGTDALASYPWRQALEVVEHRVSGRSTAERGDQDG